MFAFIGTSEIVIVLVVALLVFGPQKLPEIGRQVGSALREVRRMSDEVQQSLYLEDRPVSSYQPSAYQPVEAAVTAALPEPTEPTQPLEEQEIEEPTKTAFIAPPGPAAANPVNTVKEEVI